MKNKTLLILSLVCLLLLANPHSIYSKDSVKNDTKEPLDCGVWVNNPVRSGSYVNTTGEISCASSHPTLRVVVGLRDWTDRYDSISKTCYGASSCSTTMSLSYSPGRQWKADISGYMGSGWQAYDFTDWISIP